MSRAIQPLDASHDRSGFDCGSEPLNRFIQQVARQHLEKGISRTFVMVDDDATSPKPIPGFFSLSACDGSAEELPSSIARKLPRKIPAIRLGRLAVSKDLQGQGLGAGLLMDAFKKTALGAELVGIAGLFVDAKDEAAARFYQKFGFEPLPEHRLTLFMRIETVRKAVAAIGDL